MSRIVISNIAISEDKEQNAIKELNTNQIENILGGVLVPVYDECGGLAYFIDTDISC